VCSSDLIDALVKIQNNPKIHYYNKTDFFEFDNPDFTIFPISITRFEMQKLVEILKVHNIKINVSHLMWIKPLNISNCGINSLKNSKYGGLVLDDDYKSGCQSFIANELSISSGKIVRCLGLDDKTAGFHSKVDNLPPSAQKIADFLIDIINSSSKV
jgi:hypothetical protein